MAADPLIVEAVNQYLAGRDVHSDTVTSSSALYGIAFAVGPDVDYINTRPGGLTIFMHGKRGIYPRVPMLLLDRAFDVADPDVDVLRESIATALEHHRIEFIPASWQALHNAISVDVGRRDWSDLELIDRVGMQCVIRLAGRRYYISGYDRNEEPPLYFLARLPHPVDTFAQAIESLKPRSVKLAEAQGLQVRRQGDMFAIPTEYGSEELAAMGATFDNEVLTGRRVSAWAEMIFDSVPRATRVIEQVRRQRGLYGTAHTATEMAYLPDGTMFARGTMHHDPRGVRFESRDPDHAPLRLPGTRWYLIAKNTVPTTKRGEVNS
jgi:hypothetical protein